MVNITDLLTELMSKGVELALNKDNIPILKRGQLTPNEVEVLRQNKNDVVQLLQAIEQIEIKELELDYKDYVVYYSKIVNENFCLIKDETVKVTENLVCFTLAELKELAGCSKEQLQRIYLIKKQFIGEVTERKMLK